MHMKEDKKNKCKRKLKRQYTYLNWDYPGLVRFDTIGDGSCFFHAIASAYCKSYIDGIMNGKPIDRCDFIRGLRRDLSDKLGEKINPKDPKSPRYYDTLSRGYLKEFSKNWPAYTLDNLQNELDSSNSVSNVYVEFISDQINKDIYFLSNKTQDIYPTGDDYSLIHKDRDSIVLLVYPNHFELIGLEEDNSIITLFETDHPFIKYLKKRIKEIVK